MLISYHDVPPRGRQRPPLVHRENGAEITNQGRAAMHLLRWRLGWPAPAAGRDRTGRLPPCRLRAPTRLHGAWAFSACGSEPRRRSARGCGTPQARGCSTRHNVAVENLTTVHGVPCAPVVMAPAPDGRNVGEAGGRPCPARARFGFFRIVEGLLLPCRHVATQPKASARKSLRRHPLSI